MKVLHLIGGGDTGGAKTHLLSLLQGLNEHITADLVSFREGDFAADARALGIPTRVIAGNNIPAVKRQLLDLIEKEHYDVLHCHGSRANMMGALLKKSISVPVVSTVHSDYKVDYMGRPLGALTFGNINRWALHRMDYRIGVSDAMVDLLISRGFPPESFYAIYNGLDFTPSPSAETREEYFASKGVIIAEDDIIVGIAARLDPVKNIATLVRAFALSVKEAPRLRLIIAGDGPERDMLSTLAAELGVAERVHFLGWVSDGIDRYYRAIDINTLTSLSETFPYALTEGAREQCATVASRVGGIPYLIDHGVNGFLFPAQDAEALGGYLAALAKDESMRKRMGEALYEKASRKYSVAATIETQLSIYEDICRRSKRKAGKRDGVLICGSYGRGNGGDDAILHAIVNEMHMIDPYIPITVLSRNPDETRLRYRVNAIHTFRVFKWYRLMGRTKLYINGGGNLIQDVTSSRSLWYYLYNIAAAKRRGNKVQMYGCGIGPIVKESHRPQVKKFLNRYVDVITLREPDSLEELRLIGVTAPHIALTADPALNLAAADDALVKSAFSAAGIAPGQSCFGISLRLWDGFNEKAPLFGALADYVYEKHGLLPVFFSVENKQDPQAAELAAMHCHVPHVFLTGTEDVSLTIGILARFEAVLSMRLHTLIFAASQGTPLVGVVYDPKVSAFLRYIGEDRFVPLEEAKLSTLCALADSAVQEAHDRQSRMKTVERLRSMEQGNVRFAKELLEG